LRPAGPYEEVAQTISWYGNDNETTWQGTLVAASLSGGNASTPVDLDAVGDNAYGELGTGTDDSGNPVSIALVVMWRGQAYDFALAASPTTIQPSAVQALAQTMATRLNAGLGS
jgi:hypothetical protein